MWVLDVDRGVWSEVSELISLVYDELYQECSLVPRPLTDFISQLRDKIWEWPGDEAVKNACFTYVLLLTYMWLCALNLLYS